MSNPWPGGTEPFLKLLAASLCVSGWTLQSSPNKKSTFPLMINHLGLSEHQRWPLRHLFSKSSQH